MAAEEDRVQQVLLRVLGVLLIAVGFALIARQVQSETIAPVRLVESIRGDSSERAAKCDRRRVEIHRHSAAGHDAGKHSWSSFKIVIPESPPPPRPPSPPVFSIPSL